MTPRINKLTINGTVYTTIKTIVYELSITEHNWILDCELANVVLEIKDNILIFHSGIFYWGVWQWGIFNDGEFRSGHWKGGILKGGTFKGTYDKMVVKGGIVKGKKI